MKLYSYYRSSSAYRVRIALNLKKLPYEIIPVHLLQDGGQQNQANYLKLNPLGEVPYLQLDDHTGIAQSLAIIEYLEEIHPTPPLLPKTAFDRALVRQMAQMIAASIQPIQNLRVTQKLRSTFLATDEQVTEWIRFWIKRGFEGVESFMKDKSGLYSYRDQVTLADAFLIPQVYNALRFQVDLQPYPQIRKVYDNCMKLEAFIHADPDHQPDTPQK